MKKILFAAAAVFALCIIILTAWVVFVLSGLPNVSSLRHYRPSAATEVLDKDGRVLTEYFDRKFRICVPISSLPDIVIQAVVTAEDDTFFEHKGVNYKATWDALVHDMQKRRFARGGSTITQQMIKNVLLSREKTLTRKLREYVLARKAEEVLTKRQILQIYLNEVEWGDNIYGIEAASRYYLDKHASELDPAECALLAGMLPNPRYFNPYKRPDKAKERQERVLANMVQAKLVPQEWHETALHDHLRLRQDNSGRFDFSALKPANGRPCYHHALELILTRLFGEDSLYRGGWIIRTTLDKSLQDEMNRLEGTAPDSAHVPDKIVTVKQGDQIRAVVCSAAMETTVRDKLSSLGLFGSDYEVSAVSMDSIPREHIILSVDGDKGMLKRATGKKDHRDYRGKARV